MTPVGEVRDGVWITSPLLSAGQPSIERIYAHVPSTT